MSALIAGVDVGNATTEIVVARDGVPVAWDRVVTRGVKGSPASLAGAVALLRRIERGLGARVDEVVMAPLRPVTTTTAEVPYGPGRTGRLRVVAAGSPTPGGEGVAVGRPYPLGGPVGEPPEGGLIALVPRRTGYERAAREIRAALGAGVPITGVLAEGDEGRLIANRIGVTVPVADQVDVTAVAAAELVAVEVRPPGRPLRHLSDALFLGSRLGEREGAPAVCARLHDVSSAVVVLLPGGPPASPADREPAEDAAAGTDVPAASTGRAVIDLDAVAGSVNARAGTTGSRSLLVATLGPESPAVLPADLGVPVRLAPSEAGAARAGALTTPGADEGALVVDLGGGTVDLIGPSEEVVAAGAGDLLTAAVAAVLGVPRGAAEWVKRGPCVRVETPGVTLGEDGVRVFLDSTAPPGTVGWLTVPGPAGPLPFSPAMSPAEWRALRLSIKREVLGATVRRALAELDGPDGVGRGAVIVGGPAGDDEVLGVLARELPRGLAIGRGDVAGTLGHRYAVAYGLLVSAPP
ncbi:diol dehydratase reactivase ATPase-like domain-containing protein [Microtetraspora glauca]|uniref:Diol dehydratase reactivase ATPase-like domain-containing protein n=1 Tax=Microtetraspora glauca TaxID=1996 RepID=A0ABV3GQ56_MICGL